MKNQIDDQMTENFKFASNILKARVALSQIFNLSYQYNPRDLIYQHDKVKLYHYQPKVKKPHNKPLLVVFATVNRPEVLDLFPEHSFIGNLLQSGLDVYLLDWGYPDQDDKHIGIDLYVNRYLHHCIQFLREYTKLESIDLLGICQGGLLCLLYSLLHQHIHKLVLISCPIDFHTCDNMISHLFRRLDVDSLIKTFGNISGLWLTNFFISLRPFELVGKKYLKFIDNLASSEKTQNFLQVEKWLYDTPDQTAQSFSELIKDFYQENKLIKGRYQLGGRYLKLSDLNIPVLNIMAKTDEIIPVSASRCLKKYVEPNLYHQRYFQSGHIGIYISDKVGKLMPKAIADWLLL